MIKIIKKEDCCGCSSCAQRCPSHCIKMVEDREGFLYPTINVNNCVDCGICEKVCPVSGVFDSRPPLESQVAMHNQEEIRLHSSSGGVFSLLAEKIISEGGVVFGACFDKNWQVIIDYTDNVDGLSRFRGSKYVQARTEDSFIMCERFLKDGRTVLYSGTPCQVAGLKRFLKKEYEKLLILDFVCHGVPSPLVWRKYIREVTLNAQREVEGKSIDSCENPFSLIKDIRFRDKTDGWKKYRFVLSLRNHNDEVDRNSSSNSSKQVSQWFRTNTYMKGFLSNMTLRPSCFACKVKGFRSNSDITVADYWGVKKTMPEIDDDKGVSIVFVNSYKAKEFLSSLNYFHKLVDLDIALVGNPTIYRSAKPWYRRDKFFDQIDHCNSISNLIIKELKPTFFMRFEKFFNILGNLPSILSNKLRKQ